MEAECEPFFLSNYQGAPLAGFNAAPPAAWATSFVIFLEGEPSPVGVSAAPAPAPAPAQPQQPPVAVAEPAPSAPPAEAPAASLTVHSGDAGPELDAGEDAGEASPVPPDDTVAVPAAAPASPGDAGALGSGTVDVGTPAVDSEVGEARPLEPSASSGSLFAAFAASVVSERSNGGIGQEVDGAPAAAALALAAAEKVAAAAAAAAAARAATPPQSVEDEESPVPLAPDGTHERQQRIREGKPMLEVGLLAEAQRTGSRPEAHEAEPAPPAPTEQEPEQAEPPQYAPPSPASPPAPAASPERATLHIEELQGAARAVATPGEKAKAALSRESPALVHPQSGSPRDDSSSFHEVEANVSARLDAFFADNRLWQMAYELSQAGRAAWAGSSNLLTGGKGTYRVQVPKPYPGVQYRKSRNLEDRYPRYAANGVTVTGQVIDGGEWLQIKSNVFLPMRVGAVRILEQVPTATSTEECAADGGQQPNGACLCC
mmetsp:Transcript_26420/g.78960  ORF Transcript_26420/g.78960 Transcript_26420/m.78960 type:complete len:488 (+) Transcript_26420:97-1560(+)